MLGEELVGPSVVGGAYPSSPWGAADRERLTVAGTAPDSHRLPLLPWVQTGALHQHNALGYTRKT